MPSKRCPSCRLVNPASAAACDCGYSFATGEPPRFSESRTELGGDSVASRVLRRMVMRGILMLLMLGGVLAIRLCGS